MILKMLAGLEASIRWSDHFPMICVSAAVAAVAKGVVLLGGIAVLGLRYRRW